MVCSQKILNRYLLLAGLLLAGLLTLGAVVPTHKTVLVLSPFQLDLSINLIAGQVMREEFGKASDLSLDVYYEYLDLNRFPDSAYHKKIFDLLTDKYKNKQVDLVIVGSEAMLKLWLAQRAEILPNTPVVFFDVFTEHLDALILPADVTGVSGLEDCEKSVRWALDAIPAVNEIVLVGGVGKIEQGFFDHIQELQEDMKGQVKFTDLSGLPLAEITQRVAKLPQTTIVLYHPMFEDAEGNKYRPLDVVRELTVVSSVPVIGGYDQFIGTGIIGGYMYSIDQQAHDAIQISLRVLRGAVISTIPIAQNESNRFVFNHPALQRFDIPLSLLPPDSIVKNRQYSFWELYQPQIIATSAGIVVLLLLVIFLLVVTQRLNRTRLALSDLNVHLETQVQERTALLNRANVYLQEEINERKQADDQLLESERRLTTLMSNLPGMAYRCRNDGDWTMEFVSEGCYDLTGYLAANLIDNRVVSFGQLIHFNDQAQVWETVQAAVRARVGYDLVYRIMTANGLEKWVMERGRGVFTEKGELLALEGLISDITERRRVEEELRESEKRTATILRVSPIVIGVSTLAEGRYTDVNDAFERILGYSHAETIGRTSSDLNLWVDDNGRSQILREIQANGRVENLEIILRRKSGEVFPALVFITPITLHDTPSLLTMMMDITERKQTEEQLRETHDALQTIFHSSPLAILALDPEDRVTMWNPAAEEMFGWSDKQILGQVNPTIPKDKAKESDALRQATLNGMAFSNLETLRLKNDGVQFPVSLSVAPLRGEKNQVIGRMHIIADITELKKVQEELRQQATTDELTRVPNRRHFIELANSEIKRAVRLKRPPAVALIDIDHFKQINDTYGHAVGDQVLIGFAKICQMHIREIDVFARFGGDEFVLLLPETNQEQAYEVLERVRLAMATQTIDLGGKQVTLTISSGIASLTGDQESIDTLINQADQALYQAKEAGRNNVVRFDKLCE